MLKNTVFQEVLRGAGLRDGDVVHVQSDIRRIGPVEGGANRSDFLDFYLRNFSHVIGESGTLSVFTPFLDFGRIGAPFDLQESSSQAGVFSEHIRGLPGSIRSLHPITSLTSVGLEANIITGVPHLHSHGACSPWAQLHKKEAW